MLPPVKQSLEVWEARDRGRDGWPPLSTGEGSSNFIRAEFAVAVCRLALVALRETQDDAMTRWHRTAWTHLSAEIFAEATGSARRRNSETRTAPHREREFDHGHTFSLSSRTQTQSRIAMNREASPGGLGPYCDHPKWYVVVSLRII